MNLEILKNNGKEWIVPGKHRIYFNVADFIGLDVERYNSGSVRKAYLNGEKISNSECSRILSKTSCTKLYYDVLANKFEASSENQYVETAVKYLTELAAT